MPDQPLLSPEEFGSRTGLSQRQVYHRCHTGDIKNAKKYGWVWMIPTSEVERIKDTDWYKASKKAVAVTA